MYVCVCVCVYIISHFFVHSSISDHIGYFPILKESESEVSQSCLTLCDPMDCSLPGFSVQGIFQAWVLEWIAIFFSWGSSRPRDRTQVSCIAGRCLTLWATRETPEPVQLSSIPSLQISTTGEDWLVTGWEMGSRPKLHPILSYLPPTLQGPFHSSYKALTLWKLRSLSPFPMKLV